MCFPYSACALIIQIDRENATVGVYLYVFWAWPYLLPF